MRNIIVSNMVSLDGYIAGPDGVLDWHLVDKDFIEYAEDMLNSIDCILFGRLTYQLMEAYWPTEEVKLNDPVIAGKMNGLPKIVFSRTLDRVTWENSTLINGDIKESVWQLKTQPGKDIVILGSGTIVSTLTQMGLIDEYRFIVNPVILGSGKPQFTGEGEKKKLKLIDVRKFQSGVVMLSYHAIQ